MEDYLEVIADLQKKNGIARVRDIGAQMKVKNSSVNAALNSLTESGYAVHEKYGYVELTNKGKKIASAVKKKHDLLFKFLVDILKIDKKTAEEDACKMEHTISQKTYDRIVEFIKYVEKCKCAKF